MPISHCFRKVFAYLTTFDHNFDQNWKRSRWKYRNYRAIRERKSGQNRPKRAFTNRKRFPTIFGTSMPQVRILSLRPIPVFIRHLNTKNRGFDRKIKAVRDILAVFLFMKGMSKNECFCNSFWKRPSRGGKKSCHHQKILPFF